MRRFTSTILYILFCLLVIAATKGNWVNAYIQHNVMFIGINLILSASLNLINGYMGEFSVVHAGFM